MTLPSGRSTPKLIAAWLTDASMKWRTDSNFLADGSALLIRDGAEAELVVETKTFHVRRPTATGVGQDGGTDWEVAGATSAAALVAAGALLLLARCRHQLAVDR